MLRYWRSCLNKALAGSVSPGGVKQGLDEGFLARHREFAEREIWWQQVLSEDLTGEIPVSLWTGGSYLGTR